MTTLGVRIRVLQETSASHGLNLRLCSSMVSMALWMASTWQKISVGTQTQIPLVPGVSLMNMACGKAVEFPDAVGVPDKNVLTFSFV